MPSSIKKVWGKNRVLKLKKIAANIVRSMHNMVFTDLSYLEFHLTDHCNLNCSGCGHFSNISPISFADINQYKGDIFRLSKLFHNIHKIRIMGGEPLLHSEVASFIKLTRKAFPRADIRLATNGILLDKASLDFWNTCHETGAIIDLTVYPPFYNKVYHWESLSAAHGVYLSSLTQKNQFYAHLDLNGNSNKEKSFLECRKKYYCPFLQNGYIYPCAMPALVHYFNDKFGYKIDSATGIDLYSSDLTGNEIIKRLNTPFETCKWCSTQFIPYSWSVSSKTPQEWDVEFYKHNTELLHD